MPSPSLSARRRFNPSIRCDSCLTRCSPLSLVFRSAQRRLQPRSLMVLNHQGPCNANADQATPQPEVRDSAANHLRPRTGPRHAGRAARFPAVRAGILADQLHCLAQAPAACRRDRRPALQHRASQHSPPIPGGHLQGEHIDDTCSVLSETDALALILPVPSQPSHLKASATLRWGQAHPSNQSRLSC